MRRIHTTMAVMCGGLFVLGGLFADPKKPAATVPEKSAAPVTAVAPAKATPPKMVALESFPAKLVLSANEDSRRLLITGKAENGLTYDLSTAAVLTADGKQVRVDEDGYLVPVAQGETFVTAQVAGLTIQVPVSVRETKTVPVSFIREVVPVISKLGCNSGTCHGGQKGKAGFKLSLRGYDPLYDYRALVDDASGRRFNRSLPSQSLMLLKPTQGVPHEGGFLLKEDSRYYRLLQRWIAEGCQFDEATRRVESIEVFPKKPILQSQRDHQQLMVIAHFPDGTSRDVTREAVFETSNFEVVTVAATGMIQGVRRGEAAALVRYEGLYAAAPVTVIGERPGFEWKPSEEYNYVDVHVNNKLKQSKILPAGLCTDAEFLRRVSLDLTGVPPTVAQTRAFLADTRPARVKREAKIDELMASPAYVDHWTLKWGDLLLSSRTSLGDKGVWAFRNWIRNAVATNMPYDRFAYELMTASGNSSEHPAANYFRIAREPKALMENMTQVFLGTRFNCNQCHDHPFERWTQKQYFELAAFFAPVGRSAGSVPGEEVITTRPVPAMITHEGTGQTVTASFPFDHGGSYRKAEDSRERLGKWLTARENPYFARSVVNRYWSYFLGKGIIDPVDDIRAGNPPSNPELLDALTTDFLASKFDLNRIVRTIVTSQTYQRTYRANEWNEDDKTNFSHALPRRLAAETLYDSINIACGAPSVLPGVPQGFRAGQLPDPKIDIAFLDMFGRAPRDSPCECERSSEVSLAQTLSLINGPTISNAITHSEGLVAKLIDQKLPTAKIIEEIYLSAICRPPTADELRNAEALFVEVKDTKIAAQDLLWALLNSPEFLFNR